MRHTPASQRVLPLVAVDLLLMIGAYLAAAYYALGPTTEMYLFDENGLNSIVAAACLLLAFVCLQGFYSPRHRRLGVDLLLRLSTATGMAFILEAVMFYLYHDLALSVTVMSLGTVLAFLSLLASRLMYHGLSAGGLGPERILLIGATPLNRVIASRIQAAPSYGFDVVGYLDDDLEPGTEIEGGKVLGPVDSLAEVSAQLLPNRTIADLAAVEHSQTLLITGATLPAVLEPPDRLYELLLRRVWSQRLKPETLLFGSDLSPTRSKMVVQAFYTDILALAMLLVLSPLMVLIAILIKLTSRGPVCEARSEMGWRSMPFVRWRFRCHQVGRGPDRTEEPALTGLGRWIQRLGLAGLPQLVNILRGEMAFVGPPPIRTEFANALIRALPYHRLRFAVRPGLTGWSQINTSPDDDETAKLEYDLYYTKYMSLSLDLSIVLYTSPLRRHGKARVESHAAA
ncbi:MAG TPA: sugar transferase [Bryobacteraceae bacterium]|nr:sugar transferase [Bryobacteraceae bacterium]